MPLIDLTGQRFGRYAVMGRAPRPPRSVDEAHWLCTCDCGTERVIKGSTLRARQAMSCGCGPNRRGTKHGGVGTPEYIAWNNLRARCRNPEHPQFFLYGGRCITVCAEWDQSFERFLSDMGPRPSPRHSIDRIDNDGPYGPENCRWATHAVQDRNKGSNRWVTFEGRTQVAADWAKEIGMPPGTLATRLLRGWPIEDALTRPVQHKRR